MVRYIKGPEIEASQRRVERNIMSKFARFHGLDYELMPVLSPFDGVFLDKVTGQVRFLAECKRRYHKFGRYETYLIDALKIATARELARVGQFAEVVLLVEWDDCTRYYVYRVSRGIRRFPLRIMERKDRNDPYDKDLVLEIPISLFIEIPRR